MAKFKNHNHTVATSTLIAEVSAHFQELPKKFTKEIIVSFLKAIKENISYGSKVRIDHIGILTCKDRAARKGRNPQTGEEIHIPASKKVSFRVAKSLKERVGIVKKASKKK